MLIIIDGQLSPNNANNFFDQFDTLISTNNSSVLAHIYIIISYLLPASFGILVRIFTLHLKASYMVNNNL